jgi:hypothetical protein
VGLNGATTAVPIRGQGIIINNGVLLEIASSDAACLECFVDLEEQVRAIDLAVDASKGWSSRSNGGCVSARHRLGLASVIVEVRHRGAEPRLRLLRSCSVGHVGDSGGD